MLRMFAVSILLGCLASWAAADDDLVQLETEIPEEVLAGTPPDTLLIIFPHLEAVPEKIKDFKVPKGTANVALKKKVTSSDSNPVLGELAFVTDGNKEGSEDAYVELAPLRQWVQIDLEKECEIYAVYVWHFFREARSYHDVIIQVADDAEFTKNVRTVYSNDQDNSSKIAIGKGRPYVETYYGYLMDAKGEKARYVRLYSNGNTANDLNHYIEVEVFGKPAG